MRRSSSAATVRNYSACLVSCDRHRPDRKTLTQRRRLGGDEAGAGIAQGRTRLRDRIHDGLALPKQFRRSGFRTDLFDATDVAVCRMYRHNPDVWRGFGKNTHEGLGAPRLIVPMTIVLSLGQIAPFVFLAASNSAGVTAVSAMAALCVLLPRLGTTRRFQQPLASALLHPVAIAAMIAIQWLGFFRHFSGRPAKWKGRTCAAAGESAFR